MEVMKVMKYILSISLILVFFINLNAQDYFPDKCLGIWSGKMHVHSKGIIVDSVDVRMTIEKIPDSLHWMWKTEYISEKYPVTKNYKLILENPASNKFTLDENNGILLYSYVFGNKMFSNFEVQGTMLTSVYILGEDELIFEITSGKEIGKTGNEITNFSILNLQRSVLKRVK